MMTDDARAMRVLHAYCRIEVIGREWACRRGSPPFDTRSWREHINTRVWSVAALALLLMLTLTIGAWAPKAVTPANQDVTVPSLTP
jgi:hypothetical protein